ncbi:hypothetical protein JCM10213_004892 [Rhodosporidiobolus nylandii]
MSSSSLKVRASELQSKKRDELVKQLEELKTELVSLRVQKITGGNASKLARMTGKLASLLPTTSRSSSPFPFPSSGPPSPSSSTSAHSTSPSQEDSFELAPQQRRRIGKGGQGDDGLPFAFEPDTPMIGGSGRHPRRRTASGGDGGPGGLLRRPRFVGTLLFAALITLVLLPDGNRSRAHSALTKAGVPLPDELPERLQGFIDYLNWDDGRNDLRYTPPPDPPVDEEDMGLPDSELETPFELHPNGQMYIEPLATYDQPPQPHPILTLVKRAEQDWNRKVKRQSKTLREAVQEYRRRYKRNPPRGFEKWWAYAKANRVILVDEYDQIHRDLEPFWALEPSDLAHRVRVMQERDETFTIQVTDGKVAEVGEQAFLRRAKDLGDLIARFSQFVPNVNLTFTRHDQPACQLDWFHKERMIELAQQGEFWNPGDFLASGDPHLSNWAAGCPPESPLRQVEAMILDEIDEQEDAEVPPQNELRAKFKEGYKADELAPKRSYIYDHNAAMDICQHPEIMPKHGFTSTTGTDLGPLVPLFTFAKTNIHSDILVTPLEQYSDTYIGYDPDWEKKEHNKLMWRGSTTGIDFYVTNDWKNSQRARLHFTANEKQGTKDVLYAEGDGAVAEKTFNTDGLNRAFMDISFAGGPVQCDPETCAIMNELIDFKDTMGLNDAYQYKYVMDVDGNGWSGRFHRLMSMKAAVLKSTLFPEWYGDRIQPWLHYIPVKVDYSDLYDILTFFRGTPDGVGAHDELAKKIGISGKNWARDHWRKQDMAAYMFRLVLEWARLLHRNDDDHQNLDFDFWES